MGLGAEGCSAEAATSMDVIAVATAHLEAATVLQSLKVLASVWLTGVQETVMNFERCTQTVRRPKAEVLVLREQLLNQNQFCSGTNFSQIVLANSFLSLLVKHLRVCQISVTNACLKLKN